MNPYRKTAIFTGLLFLAGNLVLFQATVEGSLSVAQRNRRTPERSIAQSKGS